MIIFVLYNPIATADSLFMPILTQQRFSIIVTWFLAALAIVQIIYHFLLISGLFVRATISCVVVGLFYLSQTIENTSFQIGALLPSLIFYMIGHWFAQGRIIEKIDKFNPVLIVMVIVACFILAPLNRGCTLNPIDHCPNKIGEFGVLMATGQIGFVPIFLITALAGSFFVISISKKIAKTQGILSSFLCWIGNNTLDLLIANGFVFVFLQPRLQQLISRHSFDNPIAWAIGLTVIQLTFLPLALQVTRKIRSLAEYLSERFFLVFLTRILEGKSTGI
jgi:acyltransferase